MCLNCAPSERDRRPPPPHEMTVPSSILLIGLQFPMVNSALAPQYIGRVGTLSVNTCLAGEQMLTSHSITHSVNSTTATQL